MKIVIFADLHYYDLRNENPQFDTNKKLVQYALPLLRQLIRKINDEHKADISVNLGDLIQDANDKDKDKESLAYIFEELKSIKCPCYSVLGNHDLKMMDSVEEVEEIMGYDACTYSIDADGYHLVFLTTEVRPELGIDRGGCYKAQYLSEKDIMWLKRDLEKNTLPCLIFTHFILAEDNDISDECAYMKNRDKVKEIIKQDKNVIAVFSGHTHKTKTYREDGVTYYVLGSLTWSVEANGIPDGVYFEVDLKDGDMTVTEHHMEI